MLRIVKKSTLDGLREQAKYWRGQSKFTLNIPYLKVDGIGTIQVFCEDEAAANKIIERLKGPICTTACRTKKCVAARPKGHR